MEMFLINHNYLTAYRIEVSSYKGFLNKLVRTLSKNDEFTPTKEFYTTFNQNFRDLKKIDFNGSSAEMIEMINDFIDRFNDLDQHSDDPEYPDVEMTTPWENNIREWQLSKDLDDYNDHIEDLFIEDFDWIFERVREAISTGKPVDDVEKEDLDRLMRLYRGPKIIG